MTETSRDTQSDPITVGSRASGRGLNIERVYTTPGVHPYDEVTWERRDVVMTNWRDGTINFEQRGVEFPDFWSVNAANIVTTKYFRGAVGTEQREWSLKQLIDRVVLTYVKAGQVNGYFATVDDADDLRARADLCCCTRCSASTRRSGSTSVRTRRSRSRACFILAVDDTMDSILNWYKEEGLIFKGGSGAGLNLSRIRSSKELLSSGGTASGPVSFMRGADASAGTIKSGGATRRAAKMVILDVDHPDIEEFVETKAREEDKIRVLRDAGFDMDLGGHDIVERAVPERQQLGAGERRVHARRRAGQGLRAAGTHRRRGHRDRRRQDAVAQDRASGVGVRRPRHPVRRHDQRLAHQPGDRPDHRQSNPCSEYMNLDNSSCNLASLNLLKFLKDDDTFDAVKFAKVVELIITAMDISICFADFPTEKIGETTRGLPSARHRLREPRRAADGDGPRLRLRRRSCARRRRSRR